MRGKHILRRPDTVSFTSRNFAPFFTQYMSLCNEHKCYHRSILKNRIHRSPANKMSGRTKTSPELKDRLANLTDQLNALHRDLYWLAQDSNLDAQNQDLCDLTFEQIMSVKLAVDNVRELLWKYVDAVAKVEPERVHEALDANRMRRVTQLLELLRERLGRFPEQPPLSFIEKVSAAIKEKLTGQGGKAA